VGRELVWKLKTKICRSRPTLPIQGSKAMMMMLVWERPTRLSAALTAQQSQGKTAVQCISINPLFPTCLSGSGDWDTMHTDWRRRGSSPRVDQ